MKKIYSVQILVEKYNKNWSEDTSWLALVDEKTSETTETVCTALLSACRFPLWSLDKRLSKTEKATFKEMLRGLAAVDPTLGHSAKSSDVNVYSETPLSANNGTYGFMWPMRHVKGTQNYLRASAIVQYQRDEPTRAEIEAEQAAKKAQLAAEFAQWRAESA